MVTPGTPAATTRPACCSNVDRDGGEPDGATSGAAATGATGSDRHTSADPATTPAACLTIVMIMRLMAHYGSHIGVYPLV